MFILLVLMFVVVVFFNYKFNNFCNYSVEYFFIFNKNRGLIYIFSIDMC